MNEDDIISKLNPVVGQKLTLVYKDDKGVRLVFEDDLVLIYFPSIDCRCIECQKKIDAKSVEEN